MKSLIRLTLKRQCGSMVLEALVSILIFSIGILALMGFQANAIKNSVEAKYRSDAAYFANQLVSQMWLASDNDRSLFYSKSSGVSADGSKFLSWKTAMASSIPGINNCQPSSVVENDLVTVTVRWKMPQEAEDLDCHQYHVQAYITGNNRM